ncbi:MAG: helix-turn-helix transcriptional regulator, partial [Clostridia bacterium]|nr:helix-turn-helix transcriptional regulator [Clostridia bacterium]
FIIGHSQLTPTERLIFDRYIMGKTTKEIMADLNIKENTLKFHNKNIYCKLGVSSRKQLIEIAGQIDSKTL